MLTCNFYLSVKMMAKMTCTEISSLTKVDPSTNGKYLSYAGTGVTISFNNYSSKNEMIEKSRFKN